MKGLNEPFCELLQKRSLTIELLADMIFTGRPHLSQVLNGRRPGTRTWATLKKVLSAEEYDVAWNYAQKQRHLYPVDPMQGARLALLVPQRKS